MPSGKVLIVEDDDANREALIGYLTGRLQVEVDGARDGVDALHHVLTERYGIVVLDMVMPKMSGGDFLDSLKAMLSDPSLNFQGSPPAIIVVTGASEDAVPRGAIEHRFPGLVRAVFRKPVDYDALIATMERELGPDRQL